MSSRCLCHGVAAGRTSVIKKTLTDQQRSKSDTTQGAAESCSDIAAALKLGGQLREDPTHHQVGCSLQWSDRDHQVNGRVSHEGWRSSHHGARWGGKIGGFFPPCCAMNAPPLPRRQMRRTAGLILITPPAQAGVHVNWDTIPCCAPLGRAGVVGDWQSRRGPRSVVGSGLTLSPGSSGLSPR